MSGPSSGGTNPPSGAVDFFALEAGEYLDRLDAMLAAAGNAAPDADSFARNTRALRGAATMARHAALAELASALESIAPLARAGRTSWTPRATDAAVAAVDAYRALLRNVRQWTSGDDATAAARASELRSVVAAPAPGTSSRPAGIVPIARLFHDDDGPHVVERNPHPPITADQRFRQAAVPLASTLRRLIAEARQAADDGGRRAVGEDLRAAIRDLGELAESYDIAAVANFARAREGALGRLEERALEVVDGAAQALVESAGTAWARPTPPTATDVVEAPPVVRAVEPPPEAATAPPSAPPHAAHAPASGQALVALLESSISGLHRFGADAAIEATSVPAPIEYSADEPVPIETLLYRGRAALDRARAVRDVLRASVSPDPALLAELYDLLDQAAVDEPAHA